MAKSTILDKLKKNSTIKMTEILTESMVYDKAECISTEVPAMNIALSGSLDGGLTPGLTILAGPSKHFKTNMALVMGRAFQKKYQEGVILFYDSEFGSPQAYFEANGIDSTRVIHTPVTDIEQLKFDIIQQIDGLERKDEVCIIIDSIGNLASKKEVDDALEGKSVGDMTRAKQLKSLFRMVTPHLTLKQIPLIAINHTYATQEMYSKQVVSGGCLPAGQRIRLGDGTAMPVEDITIDTMVATLQGPKLVTDTWNPETLEFGQAECYEIEFEDGTTVQCSNQHPFLVDGVWVDAEDLVVGNVVVSAN